MSMRSWPFSRSRFRDQASSVPDTMPKIAKKKHAPARIASRTITASDGVVWAHQAVWPLNAQGNAKGCIQIGESIREEQIEDVTPPSGTVGVPYSVEIRGRYGTWIGFNWSVASGALPPGLLLTEGPEPFESAIISGTPTTAGTYAFTLNLVDGRPDITAQRSFTITVN